MKGRSVYRRRPRLRNWREQDAPGPASFPPASRRPWGRWARRRCEMAAPRCPAASGRRCASGWRSRRWPTGGCAAPPSRRRGRCCSGKARKGLLVSPLCQEEGQTRGRRGLRSWAGCGGRWAGTCRPPSWPGAGRAPSSAPCWGRCCLGHGPPVPLPLRRRSWWYTVSLQPWAPPLINWGLRERGENGSSSRLL